MSKHFDAATVGSFGRAASGTAPTDATDRKFWFGLSANVMVELADKWQATTDAYSATRQQHYLSAEFSQ